MTEETETQTETETMPVFKRWLTVLNSCNLPEGQKMDPISKWLIITRSCVISMTLFAGIIGGLLAIPQGPINWFNWILATVGIVIAHWSNNMINDFFDLKQGVDDDEYARAMYAPHPILSGLVTKKQFITILLVLNFLDAVILAYFIIIVNWWVVLFALSGLFISVFYVAPPFNLKKHGLGEPSVFLVWGPLMIGGTYFVTTNGSIPWWVFIASLPYAIIVTTVLFGKHTDKYYMDKAKGIKTLPVLLGEKTSRIINLCLMGSYYVVIGLLFGLKILGVGVLIVVFSIPRYIFVFKYYLKPKPDEPPEGWPIWPLWYTGFAFHLIRLTGSLFFLGLLINVFLPAKWLWFW